MHGPMAARRPPRWLADCRRVSDTFLDNAGRGSAPSGMKGSNRPLLAINHEHRNAVGGFHDKQQLWRLGDQPVADKRLGRDGVDALHNGRMYLPGLDQRPRVALGIDSFQCLREEFTITQYGLLVVF